MSKAVDARLDEAQRAVDSAGKALKDARTAFDAVLAKLAQPPPVRRNKLDREKGPASAG
jgi:hypothetical protein